MEIPRTAQWSLDGRPVCSVSIRFEIIDAQSIPYPDESFDLVLTNHMLYHLPDQDRALQEIWRVLKSV